MDDNHNNKELGLIDILQIMGHWIVALAKKLTEWFLYLVFFGLKRWKIFVIVGAAAVLYSFLTYKFQESQYEANMIIRSNAVESIQLKNFLDAYSNTLQNDLLRDSLIEVRTGMDSVQRSLISSVSTFYCIDKDRDGVVDEVDRAGRFKSSDDLVDSLHLCINVRFEDASILPLVSESMISFVNKIPFITNSNNSRLSELNKRKSFLDGEIQLLDTLQKRTYMGLDVENTLRSQNGNVLVDNRRVIVYKDKLDLLEMKEQLLRDIEIYTDPITIVEDFVIEKSAINTLRAIAKKNVFLSLVGAYFIMFIFFLYKHEKGKYLK